MASCLVTLVRHLRGNSRRSESDFKANLKIIHHNDWVSLVLGFVNNANLDVWIQEAFVVLTDLDAIWQTSIPTNQTAQQICQNVEPDENFRWSLANAIYDAAGRPQGRYSCLISVDVRCRINEKWFHKILDNYTVEMAALKVLGLRRSRWYEKKVRPGDGRGKLLPRM